MTIKLAQDIHTIIDVVEGGDISELKPLLSASRGRKSSVSVNARARHTVEVNGQNQPCTCGTELVALKGVICDIQADLLMLKQSYHASERVRSEETVCTRFTITAMTNDIKKCATTVTKHASDSNTAIASFTSSLMSTIIQLEDRIRLLESFIETEQIVTIARLKDSPIKRDESHRDDGNPKVSAFDDISYQTILQDNQNHLVYANDLTTHQVNKHTKNYISNDSCSINDVNIVTSNIEQDFWVNKLA